MGVELDKVDTREKLDTIYGTGLSHLALWPAGAQEQVLALMREEKQARLSIARKRDLASSVTQLPV